MQTFGWLTFKRSADSRILSPFATEHDPRLFANP
jgi:hypothetical protein